MRAEGWEERLIEMVGWWGDAPFVWGKADCIHFALACGEAVRGEPLCAPLPPYEDALGAKRVLRGLGARELENALMMHLEPVPLSFAQRGDIGIVHDNGFQCAVVCFGPLWIGKTETGLIRLHPSTVVRAFRV